MFLLSTHLLSQGCLKNPLILLSTNVVGRYQQFVEKYNVTCVQMTVDVIEL